MAREACPDCNSSSGYAPYPDGMYCHSCNKYTPGKTEIKEKKGLLAPDNKKEIMPIDAVKWMEQYFNGITDEIIDQHCFWSDKYKRICFPIVGIPYGLNSWEAEPRILATWMRSLDNTVYPHGMNKAKWMFAGDKGIVFFYKSYLNSNLDQVCLVEDVVSAIKVRSVMDCIALGGTNLKESIKTFIQKGCFKKVFIFLDGDEAGKEGAKKVRNELKLYTNCVIVRSTKDPKCHSFENLKEILK